jgi:hypothetical protein
MSPALAPISELTPEVKMTTGKKPASDAGRILSNPKSTPKQKEIAASDLAQAKRHPKGKK